MKIWRLRNKIYHIPSWLILGNDKEEIIKRMQKVFNLNVSDSLEGDGCCFWISYKKQTFYFIWMPSFDLTEPADLGCLGHEIYHLAGKQLRDAGVREKLGEEAGAYLFGYLFEQALKNLIPKRRKK
jgi:hypothetical protein